MIVLGHQAPPDQIRTWLEAGTIIYDLAGTRSRCADAAFDSLT